MANWLMDYIEMTEYIPLEFKDQVFAMRELDLKVSIAMSQLENDIRDFFTKIDSLTPEEKQEQYETLVKKCDEANLVATTKVKIADRLYDLVEKSMRLLDQGLEKLKEDLIEGDKVYIVEDIERRSQELDEQLRLEEETFMQRQQRIRDAKSSYTSGSHSKGPHSKSSSASNSQHVNSTNHATNNHRLPNHTNNLIQGTQLNHNHSHLHINNSTNNHHHKHKHRDSVPSAANNHAHRPYHHSNNQHNRQRNNSTGAQRIPTTAAAATTATGVKQKKRNRLNSAMTIFNRNSKTDDDSSSQTTFLSSPTTPDYLANLHSSNSNSLNDVTAGDASCLTLKGMIAQGNRGPVSGNSKSNGNDPLAKARQPILTAIDAAHAVSPNATNSDKLVLFSSNSNGDSHDSSKAKDMMFQAGQAGSLVANNQHHLFSSPMGLNISGHTMLNNNGDRPHNTNEWSQMNRGGAPVSSSSSPLAGLSRHDPIMMAASQAINATQNMTQGRRTSSLKASYAAVNSGRLQHPSTNYSIFDQSTITGEVYCKCRGTIHDPNMIACDNVNCKIEWFHYACVGITAAPAGEWYCDECRDLPRSIQDQAANTSKHYQNRQKAAEDSLQANNNLSNNKSHVNS